MTQPKRHLDRHRRVRGSSLAYAGLVTLSLIGCVAVSAVLVGIADAQKENRTAMIASLVAVDWDDVTDQRQVFDEALNADH